MSTPPAPEKKLPGAPTYYLGMDVGGSKIRAHLYRLEKGDLNPEPVWPQKERSEAKDETLKGKEPHVNQVADIIAQANEWANDEKNPNKGTLAGIGIGAPGRFDEEGKIKPGSCSNLGNPELGEDRKAHEFDGVNLLASYSEALKKRDTALATVPLYVSNDANQMLSGMVDSIQRGRELETHDGKDFTRRSLLRKRVAVLGIGTGLGHAIMHIATDGKTHFVTDGHASKLRVNVDKEDWPIVKKAKELLGDEEVVTFPDHTVRAEDLMRVPVICSLAGIDKKEDLDPKKSDHDKVLHFVGKYIARLITLIRSGQSEDVVPANGWSDQDKEVAAETDAYLIGGGTGRSKTGEAIVGYAAKELDRMADRKEYKDLKLNDIALVQYKGHNEAAYAAAKYALTQGLAQARVAQR